MYTSYVNTFKITLAPTLAITCCDAFGKKVRRTLGHSELLHLAVTHQIPLHKPSCTLWISIRRHSAPFLYKPLLDHFWVLRRANRPAQMLFIRPQRLTAIPIFNDTQGLVPTHGALTCDSVWEAEFWWSRCGRSEWKNQGGEATSYYASTMTHLQRGKAAGLTSYSSGSPLILSRKLAWFDGNSGLGRGWVAALTVDVWHRGQNSAAGGDRRAERKEEQTQSQVTRKWCARWHSMSMSEIFGLVMCDGFRIEVLSSGRGTD